MAQSPDPRPTHVKQLNTNCICFRQQKSSKTDEYLKDGRLLTPSEESMCGVSLTVGKLYLIAGKSSKLSLCNYVKEYSQMSIVERRGFSGAYKKGCACEVSLKYTENVFKSQDE